MSNQVILQDGRENRWLHFDRPVDTVVVYHLTDVQSALREIEMAVQQHGYWAAGFLSYETAPAFDPALQTRPPGSMPLLWFGLFRPPQVLERPEMAAMSQGSAGAYDVGGWRASVKWPAYQSVIGEIKRSIAAGATYQVNYTQRLRSTFSGQPWLFFLDLSHAQKATLAAYIETEQFAICSASPELFFSLDGQTLTSRPMKGTVGRGRTLAEDEAQAAWLHASPKNRAENVMIVDMIRNDMGRVARIGSVTVPALFALERYPTVWQMTSTVTAETIASLADIIGALFPCASITGAPKVRTMAIISSLETEPRGVYTGGIGYLAPDRRAQFNVAIRTAVIDKILGTAEYGVGGGIVWDSSAESEYEECQVKARVLSAAGSRSSMTRQPDFQLLESLLWTPLEGFYLLDRHLRRLADSAAYFGFANDPGQVSSRLADLAAGLSPVPHKVRLLLGEHGELMLTAEPVKELPELARLGIATEPISSQEIFLFHKTTRRSIYERASAECPDCDDVLLWNEQSQVTEATIANVVVQLDGKLVTPPVTCGLLNGTYRAHLLAEGKIEEQIIHLDDLDKAEAIFLINSIRRWRPAKLVYQAAKTPVGGWRQ